VKRSTWISISITAVVLLAAGNLSRVRWSEMALPAVKLPALALGWRLPHVPTVPVVALAKPVRVASAPHLKPAPASLLVTRFDPGQRPSLPIPPLPVSAAIVTACMASLALAFAWRIHGDRRGRVFQMARRGLPTSRIARRTHVPQDAVRTLLTPGMGARR
jgi:hypothetical protein